jgi:hypothetical protein
MIFRRRRRGVTSVGLTPSLRDAPTAACYDTNRQRFHLAAAQRCLDEPGHLCFGHLMALPAGSSGSVLLASRPLGIAKYQQHLLPIRAR